MDYQRIEILLHKYLEGISSLSEEAELKTFFTTTETIPEKLLYAKDLFCFYNEEKSSVQTQELKSGYRLIKRKYYYLSGVAASLLLGLFLTVSHSKTENEIIYAFIDGKPITEISLAEEYTKQILISASERIEVGSKSLQYASQFTNPMSIIKK